MTPDAILSCLRKHRFRLGNEKRLQSDMHTAFLAEGFPVQKEVRLDKENRIDFLIGGIGIEVKIKGGRMAIFLQLERYAAFSQIETLILVTNAAMGLPGEIGGKPVYFHSLGAGWL